MVNIYFSNINKTTTREYWRHQYYH